MGSRQKARTRRAAPLAARAFDAHMTVREVIRRSSPSPKANQGKAAPASTGTPPQQSSTPAAESLLPPRPRGHVRASNHEIEMHCTQMNANLQYRNKKCSVFMSVGSKPGRAGERFLSSAQPTITACQNFSSCMPASLWVLCTISGPCGGVGIFCQFNNSGEKKHNMSLFLFVL